MTISNIPKATLPNTFNQTPDWYRSLWQASRNGHLQEITSIIKQFRITIADFPDEFTECFKVAVRQGHKDIIDFFLSLNALKIITLKHLVYGLNSGLEQDPVLESHKEIVDAVVNLIKSDKNFPVLPEFRLYKVFKAALANNCIKVVEAITKSIEPSFLYDALKSMLEEYCIASEGIIVSRYYGDLIEATINSLTPELSWKIIEMDASSTSHTKVTEAIIKSIDPLFLYNALKSSIEEKYHAKDSSLLGYHENLIRITVNSLTPEHLCQVLHLSLEQNHTEIIKEIIDSECILYSDNYGRAFVQAVENRLIDVVQLFINSSRFKVLASDYLDQALAVSNVEIGQMIENSEG